jgi:anti-sigma factor RsiW
VCRRTVTDDPLSAIARNHGQERVDESFTSNSSLAIQEWLGSRVGYGVLVPSLPGSEVQGARICVIDDRKCAVVEYRYGASLVSYFILPSSDETPAGRSSMPHFSTATRRGFQLVHWREPGLLHVMVADLPGSLLAQFAKACVEQARRVVAWGIPASGGRLPAVEWPPLTPYISRV